MAAKSETASPAAAAAAAAAPEAEPKPAESKGPSFILSLLPVVIAALLAPAACWVLVEFLLIPRMQKKLAEPIPAATATAATAGEHGKEGGHGPGAPAASYEFNNVVVNLAGTMGTRYLKTSLIVTGADPKIHELFEAQKPRITDVTISVLSSLTLADLEEPGSKNLLREKLVAAYNQVFGHKVAEQVYFSDFVVQ